MFDSGVSVRKLIEELNIEVDIALDIPEETYVQWLDALQQVLYTEIIKEQKKAVITRPFTSPISISSSISVPENESRPRFEEIRTIYAHDDKDNTTQLIKSTLASGTIFPNTFYKDNNDIGYNTSFTPSKMTIVYIVKPALVRDALGDVNVMVPVEFIELVKAKLRGEAYKLVNEGGIAATWLNDYNVLLETFKVWVAEKASDFGI